MRLRVLVDWSELLLSACKAKSVFHVKRPTTDCLEDRFRQCFGQKKGKRHARIQKVFFHKGSNFD